MAKTCRGEVLMAFNRLERRHGRRDFAVDEIVQEVKSATSTYKDSTIRTHIASRMCKQAPDHHAVTYADLDRVGHGRYRRRS